MKFVRLFTVFVFLIALSACITHDKVKMVDDAFVGTFVGGNPDRSCGAMWWEIERNKDGTYFISFFTDSERMKLIVTEQGRWWVKEGYYYALAPKYMTEPDVYLFEILNDVEIKFISSKYDKSTVCKESYSFIDNKISYF